MDSTNRYTKILWGSVKAVPTSIFQKPNDLISEILRSKMISENVKQESDMKTGKICFIKTRTKIDRFRYTNEQEFGIVCLCNACIASRKHRSYYIIDALADIEESDNPCYLCNNRIEKKVK